jgi:hypothetical protein
MNDGGSVTGEQATGIIGSLSRLLDVLSAFLKATPLSDNMAFG